MGHAVEVACALENCRSFTSLLAAQLISTDGTRPADGTVDWVRRDAFKTRIPNSDQCNIKMCNNYKNTFPGIETLELACIAL